MSVTALTPTLLDFVFDPLTLGSNLLYAGTEGKSITVVSLCLSTSTAGTVSIQSSDGTVVLATLGGQGSTGMSCMVGQLPQNTDLVAVASDTGALSGYMLLFVN